MWSKAETASSTSAVACKMHWGKKPATKGQEILDGTAGYCLLVCLFTPPHQTPLLKP